MSGYEGFEVKPYRQGALDHWCGLYALVNAIQLVDGPYEDSSCVELFADMQRELLTLRKGRLTARVEYGVTVKEMRVLLKLISNEFDVGVRTLNRDVGRAQVNTLFGYWRALQCYFERANGHAYSGEEDSGQRRGVVLIGVSGLFRHWTVVHAVSNSALLLFDSCGIERFDRKKMTLGRRTRTRSRVVSGASTFLVYRRD